MSEGERTTWRSVKEGFPEVGLYVLICRRRSAAQIAHWTGEYWRTWYDNSCLTVTHWMPLPEPPEASE